MIHRRSIVLLFASTADLASACGAASAQMAEPPSGHAPPAQTKRIDPVGQLRAVPSLDDADVNMDGVLDETVTLSWCTGAARCRPILALAAGRRVSDYSSSTDGRFAVIRGGQPKKADTLLFVDLATARVTGVANLEGHGAPADLFLQTRWTPGDHLLMTWGSGSYVANGLLYDARGRVVLEVSAPALEVSPDGRYLLAYQPKGAPVAEDGTFAAYDLASGKAVAIQHGDIKTVVDLRWTDDAVTLDYESTLGGTRTTRMALTEIPTK